MKHLISIFLVAALIGCQKTELPTPESAKLKNNSPSTTISEIYKNDKLLYKYFYTNKRVSRIEYMGMVHDVWTYDDEKMQATSTQSLVKYVYQYDSKRQLQYMDYYLRDQFQFRKLFQYKNNAFMSTQLQPTVPGRTDQQYQYKGPWTYNIRQVTYDQNGNPKEPQLLTIAKWITPLIFESYDDEDMTLVYFRSNLSSTIKKPDYNIPAFPQPWDLEFKPPYRQLLFDWTEVPPNNEPDLLTLEKMTYYDRDANMYVVVTTEDIKLNAEGLPTEYKEVGRWYPGGKIQSTIRWRFVYTTL